MRFMSKAKKAVVPILLCISVFCVLPACGSNNESAKATESAVKVQSEENIIKVEPKEEAVKDLVDTTEIEVEAGSDSDSVLNLISYDTDEVRHIFYNLKNVDLNTPGVYTVKATINFPRDVALRYYSDKEVGDDVDSVDMTFDVTLTVT